MRAFSMVALKWFLHKICCDVPMLIFVGVENILGTLEICWEVFKNDSKYHGNLFELGGNIVGISKSKKIKIA
jgi:hypothetical protein